MDLQAEHLSRRYMRASGSANYTEAVKEAGLTLRGGTLTVLKGRSGSGKTTLLSMLGGLLQPTEGQVLIDGTDLYSLDDRALSHFRNRHIGVIPQGKAAVDSLTVLENVLLQAGMYGEEEERSRTGRSGRSGRDRNNGAGHSSPDCSNGAFHSSPDRRSAAGRTGEALALLERFGIADLRDEYPAALSGGELRRVAIARALAAAPEILLADEPTGDLDDENTRIVLETLQEAAAGGAAVLVVTHEAAAEAYADAMFEMNAGELRPSAAAGGAARGTASQPKRSADGEKRI